MLSCLSPCSSESTLRAKTASPSPRSAHTCHLSLHLVSAHQTELNVRALPQIPPSPPRCLLNEAHVLAWHLHKLALSPKPCTDSPSHSPQVAPLHPIYIASPSGSGHFVSFTSSQLSQFNPPSMLLKLEVNCKMSPRCTNPSPPSPRRRASTRLARSRCLSAWETHRGQAGERTGSHLAGGQDRQRVVRFCPCSLVENNKQKGK